MFPSTQSLITQKVFAFTPPSAPPPGDNVAPPLNTGSDDQGKLGDLGIGTATPAEGIALDVGGIIESTGAITSGGQVTGTEFSIGSYYLRPNNSANSLYVLGSITALGTTDANYFSGQVGIGTTAPGVYPLYVKKDQSSHTRIKLENSNSGTGSQVGFEIASEGGGGFVSAYSTAFNLASGFTDRFVVFASDKDLVLLTDKTNGKIEFRTSGATDANNRMVIDGSGKVGIGLNNTGTDPQRTIDISGDINFTPVAAPLATFTLTGGTGGNLDDGAVYWYSVVYKTADGETEGGYKGASYRKSIDLDAGQTKVEITNIPISSDPRVTARKIYRTIGGGPGGGERLLTTINNNTTTSYTDTTADESLSATDTVYRKDNTTVKGFYVDGSLFAKMGNWNVSYGKGALANLTSGYENVAVGMNSILAALTSGNNNIAMGSSALSGITTGGNNIGIGYATNLYNQTGSNNIGIGNGATRLAAAGNVTGNVAVGVNSLYGIANANNYNTAVGTYAGLGFQGSYNLFLGSDTGYLAAVTAVGNYNTFIGYDTGDNAAAGADNNILIGKQLDLQNPSGDNQLSIGNLIFATGINGTGTTVSTGYIGIGSASPTVRLDVTGDAAVSGTLTAGTISGSLSGTVTISSGNVSAGDFGSGTGGGNYSFPGSVGIGTIGPIAPLDVVKAGNSTGVGDGYYNARFVPAAGAGGLVLGYDSTVVLGIIMSSGTNSGLSFITNNGGTNYERMRITSSGNVGIGTTNPGTRRLKVAGDVEATSFCIGTNCVTSLSGGTYVGATSSTYSGNNNNNNGYAYAHAQCAVAFSGSHVCAAYEILSTIVAGGTLPDQDVWIFNGPPGYTVLANDCDARTKGTSAAYGTIWQKPGTSYPEGRGLLGRCDYSFRLACCK